MTYRMTATLLAVTASMMGWWTTASADMTAAQAVAGEKQPVVQRTCPIMGGGIDRTLYADVRGQRVYVCCRGCIRAVERDPEAALGALEKRGEYAESRQQRCPVMGGAINEDLYVSYKGRRIYVCCAGCLEPVRKDPASYADKVAKRVAARDAE